MFKWWPIHSVDLAIDVVLDHETLNADALERDKAKLALWRWESDNSRVEGLGGRNYANHPVTEMETGGIPVSPMGVTKKAYSQNELDEALTYAVQKGSVAGDLRPGWAWLRWAEPDEIRAAGG